jgi:hypothetical protein
LVYTAVLVAVRQDGGVARGIVILVVWRLEMVDMAMVDMMARHEDECGRSKKRGTSSPPGTADPGDADVNKMNGL